MQLQNIVLSSVAIGTSTRACNDNIIIDHGTLPFNVMYHSHMLILQPYAWLHSFAGCLRELMVTELPFLTTELFTKNIRTLPQRIEIC